jgi:hypothetical protein
MHMSYSTTAERRVRYALTKLADFLLHRSRRFLTDYLADFSYNVGAITSIFSISFPTF